MDICRRDPTIISLIASRGEPGRWARAAWVSSDRVQGGLLGARVERGFGVVGLGVSLMIRWYFTVRDGKP